MWCVENGSYVEYAGVEDFQDLDQQQALVEDKSLLHPVDPITTLRTMCGLRTGGWSLPCVMSD
jgi:hypothetical protein